MTLSKLFLLALGVPSSALVQSGEQVHCIGDRPHVLRYDVEGEPNDGSSMKGIKNAVVSMEPSPKHAAMCGAKLRGTPEGDKQFCYGVNQDSTCTSAKADIPIEDGKFDCKDCFVSATADLMYKLNYTWDGLNSVEVGLKDMHLRGSVALHAHWDGSTTAVMGAKVLADNSSSITLIDAYVGCPVCIPVTITVAAPTTVNYEVDLRGNADITAGAQLDVDLGERSVKWDYYKGWTYPKYQRTVTVKPILDMGNVQAEADVKLGVDTSLQLCMNGDADLTIGHEADLHWDLLSFEKHSHWGPQQDYVWSRPGIVDLCKDVGGSGSSTVVV